MSPQLAVSGRRSSSAPVSPLRKSSQAAQSEAAAGLCATLAAVMERRVRIIGSYLSPYVRKVLVALDWKGVAYEIDPIVPFFGDDRFARLSPIRRIPVLIDDQVTLPDSSVICQYLEDRYPEPAFYPRDLADRARARWLEEFADSRMGEVFIWGLFNQVAINPAVWGTPPDPDIVERVRGVDLPRVLDYLETEAPEEGFRFGAATIADVAIACFFRNAALARYQVDRDRWPRTAGWVERTLALPAFVNLEPFEQKSARTPIPKQREALAAIGAPITAESYGTGTPRRGVMKI
jgi:glutathione S-transferase